jgi:hypothetical protein
MESQEKAYRMAIQSWGFSDLTPEQRIRALLETPAEELVSTLGANVQLALAIDGDTIPQNCTYESTGNIKDTSLPGKIWCKDILLGSASMDVS